MNIQDLKEWLIPISASFTLFSVGISSWLAVKDYRLKLKAEERLRHSSQVEADIRLIKLFTEIMDIAHARRDHYLSEEVVKALFQQGIITKEDFDDPNDLKKVSKKLMPAIITPPIGLAAQDAAMAAIYSLAKRNEILRDVAIQALESMKSFKPREAEKYLNMLKNDGD
jgi:hypothetical protein